jgi:hypothetical protein
VALSPAHRFGQIIGEVLEAAILPILQKFAREHHLYLDKKGERICRTGKKCSWLDMNGNSHDLDFVLERGGASRQIGIPVAFIETAWRRYTKHSRNKVQEIQGAIEPLAETYRNSRPFKGAVLAGVFTKGALNQLKSHGFTVLYFSYESVVAAFRQYRIDAAFDEDTADVEFQRKVEAFVALSDSRKQKLSATLAKSQRSDVDEFVRSLSVSISRQIERIVIVALHGLVHEAITVDDAIRFVQGYEDDGVMKPIDRYEIEVRYNNGDSIQGKFKTKEDAVTFLESYQPILPKVK